MQVKGEIEIKEIGKMNRQFLHSLKTIYTRPVEWRVSLCLKSAYLYTHDTRMQGVTLKARKIFQWFCIQSISNLDNMIFPKARQKYIQSSHSLLEMIDFLPSKDITVQSALWHKEKRLSQ